MNFFVHQLSDYYAEAGKQLPEYVLSVLEKPLSSLDMDEADIYNRYIGPHQDRIRRSLMDIYRRSGAAHKEWAAKLSPYYRPIVEEMAAQVLGLEGPSSLPQRTVVRLPYQAAEPPSRLDEIKRYLPALANRWTVVIAVVLVVTALLGWWYFSATAPSRLLNRARGEMEKEEYALAVKHCQELEERYPGSGQAEEAYYVKTDSAFQYAQELLVRGRYEEAVYHYELAGTREEYEADAQYGKTGTYSEWAEACLEADDHELGFECCEAALGCRPEGYDIVPVMELRARILFRWGEQFREQGDYAAAALRFEKCYKEWPAGTLADKALYNYVDMTVANYTGAPPPSKSATSPGQIKVEVINQTGYILTYFFSGPSTMCFDLAPGASHIVHLLPGVYNRGSLVEDFGARFEAGTNFTDTAYWWQITIPIPPPLAAGGVGFEDVMRRVDELEQGLPVEISDYVVDLEYEMITDPDIPEDHYGHYDPVSDTVSFAAFVPADKVDRIIFHEWGHAFDDEYLDDEEREEYMRLRDILPGTAWENPDDYMGSVEEDFAEVFAVVFGNVEWFSHTPYGPIDNVDELRAMILQAAD